MNEEKKIFCFNAKLNSDRYFNPKSDAFKKTYILIDDEKILLKDLWEEHKQLKRLEQENKELKELKCKFKEYCTCDTERLKAENEQLKETNLQLQTIDMEIDRNNRYRKALEEIRSYVNTQLDGFGNDVYGITKNQITTITNKINEVLK